MSARRWCLLPLLAVATVHSASGADVALDVGHTVLKPGAISERGVTELELNQILARDVAQALTEARLTVHLINADGQIDELSERTLQARSDRLFISIHHDSVKPRYRPVSDARFKGFSLWVSEQGYAFSKSRTCARLIGEQLLAAGFRPSQYHAHPVWGENRRVIDGERGVFANHNLAVLRTARTPAVLVEAGVIAHPDEEALLAQPEVHARLTRALATGIEACIATEKS